VPTWLQLPLSMIEWWCASYDILVVQKTMGMAAPSLQQQLLDALLIVGVPWVPLLLQLVWQHAAPKCPVHPTTGQEQGCAGSQGVASSSGAGASKHLSPGDNNSSSGAAPGTTDLKGQGTGVATGIATTPSTARRTGCASNPVQPSSVSKDTSYCRSTPPASASVSSSSDSSSLVHQGPLAAVEAEGSSGSGLQAGKDPSPDMHVEQNPVLDMLQRLLQGHPLPAAAQLHAAAAAGALQLPHDMRYTSCTCMVPVSVKVSGGWWRCVLCVSPASRTTWYVVCMVEGWHGSMAACQGPTATPQCVGAMDTHLGTWRQSLPVITLVVSTPHLHHPFPLMLMAPCLLRCPRCPRHPACPTQPQLPGSWQQWAAISAARAPQGCWCMP
jgi:hypothetical protein